MATTKQIMQLDCREQKNCEIIQKVLRQIKPLSRYSDECDIPFEAIEKAIVVMEKKYNMRIRDFVPDVWSNAKGAIWRATLIDDNTLKTIELIYGLSVYEVFAKSAIRMYAEVRNGISTRK
ncbi:MAG: hypothetical protein KBT03_03500 [Bacteroidales bacterium]|nr:hypothetical protein [Candidatus Scybalousia scybalohippi]